MSTTLRTIEFLCLGVWIGGICLLSFVVAPGAFSVMPNQTLAADIVRFTLSRLHLIGIGAGVVYVVVAFLRHASFASFARAVIVIVLLMIVLTVVSQFVVTAHMVQLRRQMDAQTGSVSNTPVDNPLRAQFDQLHHYSVWIEGTVLLLGIAAMYLTVRGN
jgi:uncharacterized membrane protein